MRLSELNRKFPTEIDAINHYIGLRYQGILTCPKCGSKNKVYRYRKRAKFCQCKSCNGSFSVFSGTIFEGTRTDIRKWFCAIDSFFDSPKGISSPKLRRRIHVTQKCAWRMLKQIKSDKENIWRTYVSHHP